MSKTPVNLTPMESALLESLQHSSQAHEQRLNELEKLLVTLNEQSQRDSVSGLNAFESLRQRLCQVSDQLLDLEDRLSKWTPILSELAKDVEDSGAKSLVMIETYSKAVEAFNLMKIQYLALASQVNQLRELAG